MDFWSFFQAMYDSPDDLKNGQVKLLADATATGQGVASCAGADATTKQEWATFYAGVQQFCAIVPTWYWTSSPNEQVYSPMMIGQLQQYQAELFAWQQKLSGIKCNVLPNDPTASKPTIDTSTLTALRWAGVIAGSISTAYIVGKVASTINIFGTTSLLKSQQRQRTREQRLLLKSRAYR